MDLNRVKQYTLVEKRELKELASIAYVMRHNKTGARIFLLENDDNNKVFDITFRTPPKNSTGVPHIMEHSVLCGSKKYPVKDPFVELVKGSLNTFLNAMTYPDKTMYPVASCNDKDFQNLMSVYLDAVLYPNIYENERIFNQEGWHYEVDPETGKIIYNGVVYNEMKGAYSSPDGVLERHIQKALFPHNAYANDSGGDPVEIPNLTYEEFLDFHRTYYHPSNSYIYLYGDMDMAEKLNWIDEQYLSHFEKIEINSEIQDEPPFSEMAEMEIPYGIAEGESEENGVFLSWSKVTGSTLDAKRYLAFQVLEYALLNAPGAPLKKALLDAGIGNDIYGGYESELRQTFFSVVAKNTNKEQKEAFVTCIEDTLKKLVKEGLNRKSLQAGVNIYEFRAREADYGRFPKGLMYGLQCFDSWLYDDKEPLMHLAYDETFSFLREAINTGYYEKLVQDYLIDNRHGAVISVVPQKGYTAAQENAVAERLEAFRASLTEEQLEQLKERTEELKAYQDTPSTKEALECIPTLQVSDIEKKARPLINEMRMIKDVPVLFHDVFTGEIGYLDLLFRADSVTMEDLPYVSLLKSVLGCVDTEHYSYQELADEINIHTGGIMPGISFFNPEGDFNNPMMYFGMRAKALYGSIGRMLELIKEILMYSKLDDEKRLHEIISELRSRMQTQISSSGHSVAVLRAASYYSCASYLGEMTSGISYYHFIENLDKEFEQKKETIIEKLKLVCSQVFGRDKLFVSYTSDEEGYRALEKTLEDYIEGLPELKLEKAVRKYGIHRLNEGFQTSSQVQYVARCGGFLKKGYPYTGAMKVLQVILNYDYLWINLRVKGGAYGCMSGMGRDGQSYFVSYRDPNLEKTNEVYEKIPEYVRSLEIDDRDMTRYIIGAVNDMDIPQTPSIKGLRGLNAYMSGVTDEQLQRERDQVLNATVEDLRELAETIECVLKQDFICVVGNEDKIKAQENMFKEVKQLFH